MKKEDIGFLFEITLDIIKRITDCFKYFFPPIIWRIYRATVFWKRDIDFFTILLLIGSCLLFLKYYSRSIIEKEKNEITKNKKSKTR